MSNGTDQQANCAGEICCGGPDDEAKQVRALTQIILHEDPSIDHEDARKSAAVVLRLFDLAGKGTLYKFKQWVVRLHEAGPYKG